MSGPPSPILRARTDALWAILTGQLYAGRLPLTREGYAYCAACGLSRSDVGGAVDRLVSEGRVTVAVEGGVVVVRCAP